MKNTIYILTSVVAILFYSCTSDLDQLPIDPNQQTSEIVYATEDGYNQVVAKIYAGLSLTGQEGPAGNGDVGGIDEGGSSYLRNLWNAQVLTTDEAICSWGDFGIPELNFLNPSAVNPFLEGLYYRLYHEISMSNEFLRQSTDSKLEGRGQSALIDNMKQLRAEARFLRAFAYWNAIDLFGDVPFVTEEDGVGSFLPPQSSRAEMFSWLIAELDALSADLPVAGGSDYGRIDQGAAWMLKAKLYLNAEVYTGTAMYSEVITEVEKINSAYTLYEGDYKYLFYGDNNEFENPDVTSGFIFTIPTDGSTMQSYGGTTFIMFSATGGGITTSEIGISGGWGGNRARPELVDRFDAGDMRGSVDGLSGMLFDSGAKEVANPANYADGFGVMKFRNIRKDGVEPAIKDFASTDFPLFRLADSYLMYAEAVVRGGGGSSATALTLVNKLRTRAFGDISGNITAAELTLDFLLEERGRELYWECGRRTDLVRFGKFTSADYLWSWKGGTEEGAGVRSEFNIFGIPSKDIGANPNLTQNKGY